MPEEKCPHSDCKGSKKKYKRLSAHTKIVHEGGTMPGGASARPAGTAGADGSFGSQIGRALDPSFDFSVADSIRSGASPVPTSAHSSPSVGRVLVEGDAVPTQVFRRTGIPVIRKVGHGLKVIEKNGRAVWAPNRREE